MCQRQAITIPLLETLCLEIKEKIKTIQYKALTHSHIMTPFDTLGNKPFENTVGNREIARNEQFLLFP